jgi:hypothetical protein
MEIGIILLKNPKKAFLNGLSEAAMVEMNKNQYNYWNL